MCTRWKRASKRRDSSSWGSIWNVFVLSRALIPVQQRGQRIASTLTWLLKHVWVCKQCNNIDSHWHILITLTTEPSFYNSSINNMVKKSHCSCWIDVSFRSGQFPANNEKAAKTNSARDWRSSDWPIRQNTGSVEAQRVEWLLVYSCLPLEARCGPGRADLTTFIIIFLDALVSTST